MFAAQAAAHFQKCSAAAAATVLVWHGQQMLTGNYCCIVTIGHGQLPWHGQLPLSIRLSCPPDFHHPDFQCRSSQHASSAWSGVPKQRKTGGRGSENATSIGWRSSSSNNKLLRQHCWAHGSSSHGSTSHGRTIPTVMSLESVKSASSPWCRQQTAIASSVQPHPQHR
jgi:hypothetical protein